MLLLQGTTGATSNATIITNNKDSTSCDFVIMVVLVYWKKLDAWRSYRPVHWTISESRLTFYGGCMSSTAPLVSIRLNIPLRPPAGYVTFVSSDSSPGSILIT